jgi:hypothetical protein
MSGGDSAAGRAHAKEYQFPSSQSPESVQVRAFLLNSLTLNFKFLLVTLYLLLLLLLLL